MAIPDIAHVSGMCDRCVLQTQMLIRNNGAKINCDSHDDSTQKECDVLTPILFFLLESFWYNSNCVQSVKQPKTVKSGARLAASSIAVV